ncbi:MAG: S8 family serine peptidase [Verrucomicrobiota bacterium]|nr:S8 family serine peptidase [Verrucomicrobiota bacterium]
MKTLPHGLLAASLTLWVAAGAWTAGAHPAEAYVPGDVIVTFKPSVGPVTVRERLTGHSLVWKHFFARLSRFRGCQTGLVHAASRTTPELMAELLHDPDVETAEPNYLRWVTGATPNDTFFTNQWALQNTGQAGTDPAGPLSGTAGDDIHFLAAWALARPAGTNPPVVAVIDTGVDYNHPDLHDNMWVNTDGNPADGTYGYDFADNDPDPSDSGFHGTHVAGIIAAVGDNGMGVIGVDFEARIMALRASNDGETLADSAVIEAIDYAVRMKGLGVNVVVINESFGGAGYDGAELSAMEEAGSAGIIFCCAAGNNSSDNDTTPIYPANYGLSNEIVVAATDDNDNLASFSDYGASTVDLGAPGVQVLSLLPVDPLLIPQGPRVTSWVVENGTNYSADPMTFSGITTNVTGVTATVYNCGLGNPPDFPSAVSNNIALIQRGTLTFSNKVANAMAAGARAAIIYNNAAGSFFGTLQSSNDWIPAISISEADGVTLAGASPATASVISGLCQYLDGTSMAAPQVSGAVAFAAMNFPSDTVSQRVQRVLANVDVVSGLQGLVRTGGRLNIERIVDSDGNGLPDWWEEEYFGHLGVDPNADPDHDGMSNLAEWIAGTNPTNAASCLRLSASSAGTSVVLSWPSAADRSYWIERGADLLAGFDSTIATNIVATVPTNTATDAVAPDGSTRFYRVGVEHPTFP